MVAFTGTDALALVLGLFMLAAVIFVGYWLVRLIRAPFRMLRRSAPTGLGAQYEQLVRTKPPSSAVVLPSPRRARPEEPPETARPFEVGKRPRLWRRPAPRRAALCSGPPASAAPVPPPRSVRSRRGSSPSRPTPSAAATLLLHEDHARINGREHLVISSPIGVQTSSDGAATGGGH
jgi:hypothetical protein